MTSRQNTKTIPTIVNTSKLGTILITLNLTGRLKDENIPFVPNMISPNYNDKTIYFPMTVKLSDSVILEAVPEIKDPLFALIKLQYFSKFMFYTTNKTRYKAISLETEESKKIIKNNIIYVVQSFFKKYIQINGRAYRILSKNISKTEYPKSKNDLITKITVTIDIIDKDKDTYKYRLAHDCQNQRKQINDTAEKLFNVQFFEPRIDKLEPSTVKSRLGPLYSSVNTGNTTGSNPKKTRDFKKKFPWNWRMYNPIYNKKTPKKEAPKKEAQKNGGTKKSFRRIFRCAQAKRRAGTQKRAL